MKQTIEEASSHNSAKTHASNVFVTHDLDHWPFDPKINGFPGLIMEHFYVTLGDPSCIGFWDIMQKTDRHTVS